MTCEAIIIEFLTNHPLTRDQHFMLFSILFLEETPSFSQHLMIAEALMTIQ